MIQTKPASTDYEPCKPERGRFVLWSFPKGKWHAVLSVDDDDSDGEWLIIHSLCGKYQSTRFNKSPAPLFTREDVEPDDTCKGCLERVRMRGGWSNIPDRENSSED